MRRPNKWSLAEALDFEAFVSEDKDTGDTEELKRRDARLWIEQIAPELGPEEKGEPKLVFLLWTRARRTEGTTLGLWLEHGWRILCGCGFVGGLVMAFVVAWGALYYTGGHPVNIAVFLGVTVGIQWLLLCSAMLVTLVTGMRAASERLLFRWSENFGLWLASVTEHLPVQKRMKLRAKFTALRKLAGRNLELLRWPPWMALQVFGMAWNVGVLAALLIRVSFTEIAFGWESTLAQSQAGVHRLAQGFAVFWTWFVPGACPTLEQVEKSQFHYPLGIDALDRAATSSWWHWLVGVILIYGLLPRAALLFWFLSRLRSSLQSVTFDEPRHHEAWRRIKSAFPTEASTHEKLPDSGPITDLQPDHNPEQVCVMISSELMGARADIERWINKKFDWELAIVESIEIDYPSGNNPAFARLAAMFEKAPRWLIAVPAPFTAFAAFEQCIERLRTAGSKIPQNGLVLVVSLDASQRPIAPEPDWEHYWKNFVLKDTYLADCTTIYFRQ